MIGNQALETKKLQYQKPTLKVLAVTITNLLQSSPNSLPANIKGPGFSASRSARSSNKWEDTDWDDE